MRISDLFVVILVVLVAGCGGGNGNGNGDCPDMAGTWEVVEHCEAGVVGTEAVVTQNGCEIVSVWEGDATFTGTINADGSMTFSGDPGGGTINCTGTLSGNTWTSDCEPIDCHVVTTKK
jgi:hypothetical protein